jgi:YD repeat-containing protein
MVFSIFDAYSKDMRERINSTRRAAAYVIACLLFVHACKTEDAVNPPSQQTGKCFLVKSTSTYSSSATTNEVQYTRNAVGKVTEIASTTRNGTTTNSTIQSYSYDTSGKLTKVEGTNNFSTYTYNDSGQLTNVNYYLNNAILSSTQLQYNSSGQITRKLYFNTYTGPLSYTGYREYTYPDATSKNANKETLYNANNEIQFYVEYEYDTHFIPVATIAVDQSITVPSVNNITKSTYTQIAGASSVNISTNTYTYNDKRYPTQAAKTAYAVTETIVYEYSCQ